ncbi:MAG: Sigma-70, region 4, partial [Patescibacteria group bacterium]|nr:Sigma-70, region 4 [Patescibacteria group bacterium]
MRYVDDMTIQEIAELTGDQPNSISVRLHRALKKLKELHDERLR